MRIGYTNRQQCILDGKLPMKDIKRVEIRELARRAELNNDQEVLDSLDGILKQYDLWVESHYTKRQMRYITGEKPADEIGQYALAKLYEHAKKQGDEQIAEWAWDLMTRNNKSSFSQWQMRIIRGVIPTEKVGEGALMSLANRALFLKDQEIVDWAVEKLKERGIAYTPVSWSIHDTS